MRTLRGHLIRLSGLFNKRRKDRELEEEFESHLQMHIDDNLRAGMTPAEARRAALLKAGGVEAAKEAYRDRRGMPALETVAQDIRYAARTFRQNPGFTLVVVLILALGIGANTAIFSLFDAVLLRMLPVRNPEQLMYVDVPGEARAGNIYISTHSISVACLKQMQERATTVAGLAAYRAEDRLNVGVNGHAELASGHFVSGSYFPVLGVRALLGRTIEPDDDQPAGRVAVISFGFWQRRFGGDPRALGSEITVNNVPFTIAGIGPREFYGLSGSTPAEIMLPAGTRPQVSNGRLSAEAPKPDEPAGAWIFARLKRGASSSETAAAELGAILRQTALAEAGSKPDPQELAVLQKLGVHLRPASRDMSEAHAVFSQPLRILMAVVALVMLIACANIANLMLARSSVRQREIAIRLSLGSGRARLIRQLLTESLLLSLLGASLGIPFAVWARSAIVFLAATARGATNIPAHWDLRVLAFTAAVSILTAFLFGVAPALRATRVDLTSALKKGRTQQGTRSTLGRCLVAGQVALSLALLVGAALFLSTFRNIDRIDTGFARENVLLVTVGAKLGGYEGPRAGQLYIQALDRIGRIPGVRAVSLMQQKILSGGAWMYTVWVPGYTPKHGEDPRRQWVIRNAVGPRFVSASGLQLLSGRDLYERDDAGAPKVALINETMARHFFEGRNPIGQRMGWDRSDGSAVEIVGVVRDFKYMGVRDPKQDVIFTPLLQSPKSCPEATLLARTTVDPARIMNDVRSALRRIDPNLPLYDMTTRESQIESNFLQERLLAILSGFFALLALGLSSVGLYGVISYSVARRTGEIGIRMALGARQGNILRLVVSEAARMIAIGLAIGLAIALSSARLIQKLLFGVTATDKTSIAAAVTVLTASALLAAFLPARRAARVDPITALRHE